MDHVRLPQDSIGTEKGLPFFPFPEPRDSQAEALEWAIEGLCGGLYDNVILEAPTGVGKSAVALGLARYAQAKKAWRTYLLCHRRTLQLQYHDTFDLPLLYGRSGYFCKANTLIGNNGRDVCSTCIINPTCRKRPCTVDKAPCVRQPKYDCQFKPVCEYYVARDAARNAPISVLGSHYLFLEELHVGQFGARDLCVFDEAHRLEEEIYSLFSWKVTERTIRTAWTDGTVMLYLAGGVPGTLYWMKTVWETTDPVHRPAWKPDPVLTAALAGPWATLDLTKPLVRDSSWPDLKDLHHWAAYFYETAKALEWSVGEITMEIATLKEMGGEIAKSKRMAVLDDELRGLEPILRKAELMWRLLLKDPDNWVMRFPKKNEKRSRFRDHGEEWVEFCPVHVGKIAPRLLDMLSPRRLFMSATVPRTLISDLGLESNKTLWVSITKSPFPASLRPIFYAPVADMSFTHRQESLPTMLEAIEQLVLAHPDDRVLILPHSQWLAEAIAQTLYPKCHAVEPDGVMAAWTKVERFLKEHNYPQDFSGLASAWMTDRQTSRVLRHGNDPRERDLTIAIYEAVPRSVLVSTYLGEGYSGDGEKCRLIIIPKVPYADMKDPLVARRMADDPDWYRSKTILSIVQQAGRGVRFVGDSCKVVILDSCFESLHLRSRSRFPPWFNEALVRVKPAGSSIPDEILRPLAIPVGGVA